MFNSRKKKNLMNYLIYVIELNAQDEQRLRGVLKFANACGAITTTKKGAIPALPSESDAFTLIKGA